MCANSERQSHNLCNNYTFICSMILTSPLPFPHLHILFMCCWCCCSVPAIAVIAALAVAIGAVFGNVNININGKTPPCTCLQFLRKIKSIESKIGFYDLFEYFLRYFEEISCMKFMAWFCNDIHSISTMSSTSNNISERRLLFLNDSGEFPHQDNFGKPEQEPLKSMNASQPNSWPKTNDLWQICTCSRTRPNGAERSRTEPSEREPRSWWGPSHRQTLTRRSNRLYYVYCERYHRWLAFTSPHLRTEKIQRNGTVAMVCHFVQHLLQFQRPTN